MAADVTSEDTADSVDMLEIENNVENGEEQAEPSTELENDEPEVVQQSEEDLGISEENQGDTVTSVQGLINYVGVEYSYLETPAEQQVVVSYGDGSENVSEARLICQKTDGSILELEFSEKENELYLFKHVFGESETGVYQIVCFAYTQDGRENSVDLASIGIEAMFGVNEYYPGYEAEIETDETGISAEDIEISVVNVDTDNVEAAERDIEEAIETTTENMEEETTNFEDSDNVISKTVGDFLTSVAGVVMPTVTAKAAENVVVVLDPGHGGSDGGAAANGLVEKELTLKIAKYCKAELEEYSGVTVYMTRESDEYVGLTERVQMAKNWGADVFVSIHINSAVAAANGAEVWYPNSSYNAEIHNQGAALSEAILEQLVALGLADRGIKIRNSENNTRYPDGSIADYYSVIRDSKSNGFPGIIVEHAFITNASDAAKMAQESFLKKLGIADATGIVNYFGLTKGSSIQISDKDDFAGTAQVSVAGLGKNAKVKIWNEETKASKEYSVSSGKSVIAFNVNEYGGARGTYFIEAFNASGVSLKKISFYVSKDTSSTITIDSDGTEKQYKVNIKFADMPSEISAVEVPVWTSADQSDIVWYQAKKISDGVWQATIDVSDYKTAGIYNVHVYAKFADGILKGLGSTSFEITKPTFKVDITNYSQGSGTFDVVIKDIISPSGIVKIQVPVWCASNQSDIKWYDAVKQKDGSYKVTVNIANHNYAIGTYQIHTYLTTGNGIQVGVVAGEQKVIRPGVEISARDIDGKETTYELKVANTELFGVVRNIQFATWSENGGQDDIIWYSGSRKTSGEWTATAKITNHKTAGKYNVHVYATLANGTMSCLGAATFEVTNPSMNVMIQNYDVNKGTFEVVVNNISAPSGISKIQVPVWCAADQSDIKWYDAVKQDDESYKVTVSMANHKYAIGTYQVHTYLTTGNGLQLGVVAGEQKVVQPNLEISAIDMTGKEATYELKVANVGLIGMVKNVQFATWSEKGGQDDIIWYSGSKNSLGEWIATAKISNHKTSGKYNVHVYATLANGTLRCLGATTFEVTSPSMSATIQNYDANKGTFEVVVNSISAPSGVSKIQVPVWCATDQSDIKWYDAVKQSDGSYKTTVSMANHKYAIGTYQVHVYLTAENGLQVGIVAGSQKVVQPNVEISAKDTNGKETEYELKVANAELVGVVKNVQFATWSEKDGQDDIIWYSGSRNSLGEWTSTVKISNHKTLGLYNVHAYATLANGTMRCLGATTFNVSGPSVSSISVKEYDETTGMFKVAVSGITAPSGITSVQVPVWCASDQSDIKWYDAIKQDDGTYEIKVDPMNHRYNSGLYKIHVYVTMGNGIQTIAGSCSQLVVAAEYYTIMGETTTTVDQMVEYYKSGGYEYPSIELGAGGASTLEKFCQLYYEEAIAEGVRAEVAFAQAMKETKWLQYGGIVQISQFNFAGLGAVDGNETGNCASFDDVRMGIRAQIQHLKAYATTEPLNSTCVDPRFNLVTRGCAPYVEWLGQKENPSGTGWATEIGYGASIVTMIRQLKIM